MRTGSEAIAWPAAPEYVWSGRAKERQRVECERSSGEKHNFFRSARWCHDSSSILTTAEDRVLRVYDCSYIDDSLSFAPARSFSQPDAINAATWYPSACAISPETFCFVASVRDTPVRLIDATDGRIRASYPIIDHRERFVSPHCLAFNPAGTKLYGGHENAIEVLDIANPGPDSAERLKTTSTRKERDGQKGELIFFYATDLSGTGLRLSPSLSTCLPEDDADGTGIMSSIAFSTDYSGTYAAGSFSGSVAIYSEDTAATAVSHLDGVHPGGVTHLAFHPLSPQTLFVGSRRSSSIQVYDLRDTSAPVGELPRRSETNQRLSFDVDPWGRWLASGDEDGMVKVWDITDLNKPPVFEETIHNDAIGSVQLHPFKPLLLSVGGSRAFLQAHSVPAAGHDSESDSETDSDSGSSDDDSLAMDDEQGEPMTAAPRQSEFESDPAIVASSTSSAASAASAVAITQHTRSAFRSTSGTRDRSLRVWSFA